MSVQHMAEVFRHGPTRPADRLMLLAIADHANDSGQAWPGLALLAEKCAVGVRAASATIKRLEAAGWLEVTRGTGRQTSVYRLRLQGVRGAVHVTPGVQSTTPKPPVEPPVEPPLPVADASGAVAGVASTGQPFQAAEREQMSTAREAKPAATDQPLMGMPEPETRTAEPNAGELVRAWCSAWSDSHGGAQPHGSVVRRVAGVCRNVAKDCADIEEWRAAWRAAQAAGRAGRYDVVAHLAAPVQQTRGNHFLTLAQNTAAETQAAQLAAFGGPRALGASS